MATYRKTATIEAWQLGSAEPQPTWFIQAAVAGTVVGNPDFSLTIKTLEGDHRAEPGDWIAMGVEGELWPIKPAIFSKTYSRVSSEDTP